SDFLIKKARENGARVVCIDPRMTMSSVSLADEWIPIRPGTDVAMMSAMAYVIITEELYDEDFVRRCCVGFDSSTMPAGADDAESYADYILGVRDGIPKTPAWAEAITAVPAATIARIAREYATTRPGVLYQGYGMQRRAYGEQVVRAGAVLAAITGNVGIPGGWASALASPPGPGPFWFLFPMGENPYGREIPCFLWSEAVLRGKGMGPELGVLGRDRLESDIKLIYAVASNALINQHANINRSAAILRDESKVEFLVVQDNFLTSTARFADIVLPACTQFETWGLADGWKFGEELLLMPQVVEPLAETRSDYRICADLAERLGIGAAYTEGRDERGWVEWLIHEYRRRWLPDLPSLDELVASNQGVHSVPVTEPRIAFADFRTDPEACPLDTPSGKVEIFSQRLHEMGRPDDIPAVPKYIEEWESPFGVEAARYPLQALGSKTLHRVHSTHDNVDWLEEAFPQVVFINPVDAGERDIADGDRVRVYNDRGEMVIPRGGGRAIGRLVDPRREWCRSPWFRERADQRALDAAGVRQCTAHDHGSGRGSPVSSPMSSPAARYRFHFDASACAGCKACQIACKDKHGLEVGRLWRRVYEVTGGEWRRSGSAWLSDVFAFHLSVACNHCQRPICVEVCPSRALRQRDDGIVLLDTDRCLGCSYCEWACPYGALQYDKSRGYMTKCTFCVDEIDAGRPPVCVTSCPLRVLEYGESDEDAVTDSAVTDGALTQDPLPDPRITRPALVMREHRDAGRAREESIAVVPQKRHELRGWSLVAFTLLAQLAAGTVLVGGVSSWIAMGPNSELRGGPGWLVAGIAIAVALLLSLRHLGAPRRALLAACNWRTSWLSREIIAGVSLTVACNHCQRPICVEVCPSRALRQRDDGIVLLDTDRCLGCSYCEWACPYGA
ncbi:MAG: DMSO/selenate family reductase complex B subunit, partial [Planctomycetota bacterium]